MVHFLIRTSAKWECITQHVRRRGLTFVNLEVAIKVKVKGLAKQHWVTQHCVSRRVLQYHHILYMSIQNLPLLETGKVPYPGHK